MIPKPQPSVHLFIYPSISIRRRRTGATGSSSPPRTRAAAAPGSPLRLAALALDEAALETCLASVLSPQYVDRLVAHMGICLPVTGHLQVVGWVVIPMPEGRLARAAATRPSPCTPCTAGLIVQPDVAGRACTVSGRRERKRRRCRRRCRRSQKSGHCVRSRQPPERSSGPSPARQAIIYIYIDIDIDI